MRPRFPLLVSLSLALATVALGGCADRDTLTAPRTAPSRVVIPSRGGDRVATIEWEGRNPRLYLQNLDGSDRVRVSFAHVSDHVVGNYSPQQLPVTDETLTRITSAKWSPDGRYLAVIVAPSSEALQVVIVTADGRALRTVSPNSQYLWGSVEWSPDASRLAYIMATGPYGLLPDVFVTELGADRVTRLTTGAKVSGYDAMRFDATGTHLFFTEHLGFADDEVNSLTRLASVDLTTGEITRGETVVGDPQAIARDGSWALFVRTASESSVRELFRLPLPSNGAKPTVLASGQIAGAVIAEDDAEALLNESDGGVSRFSVIGLAEPNDGHGKVVTSGAATWASLWRAP